MKKIVLCTVISLMILITICAVLLIRKPTVDIRIAERSSTDLYRVTVSNGQIVICENEKIIARYPEIIIENLPKRDRDLLKNGISASTKAAAEQIVEDFDG